MAFLNFDATTVAPSTGQQDPMPNGWQAGIIVASEIKPTKAGTGAYLELTFSVLEGIHANKKAWARLNLDNPNPTAVEIAYSELSAICHATGVLQLQDSDQLHQRPLKFKLKYKPPQDGRDATNEIVGYKRMDEQVEMASNVPSPPPEPVQPVTATWGRTAPQQPAPQQAPAQQGWGQGQVPAQQAPAQQAPAQQAPQQTWSPQQVAEQPWQAPPQQTPQPAQQAPAQQAPQPAQQAPEQAPVQQPPAQQQVVAASKQWPDQAPAQQPVPEQTPVQQAPVEQHVVSTQQPPQQQAQVQQEPPQQQAQVQQEPPQQQQAPVQQEQALQRPSPSAGMPPWAQGGI